MALEIGSGFCTQVDIKERQKIHTRQQAPRRTVSDCHQSDGNKSHHTYPRHLHTHTHSLRTHSTSCTHKRDCDRSCIIVHTLSLHRWTTISPRSAFRLCSARRGSFSCRILTRTTWDPDRHRPNSDKQSSGCATLIVECH